MGSPFWVSAWNQSQAAGLDVPISTSCGLNPRKGPIAHSLMLFYQLPHDTSYIQSHTWHWVKDISVDLITSRVAHMFGLVCECGVYLCMRTERITSWSVQRSHFFASKPSWDGSSFWGDGGNIIITKVLHDFNPITIRRVSNLPMPEKIIVFLASIKCTKLRHQKTKDETY